jgi:hypothetical protein
VRLNFTRVGAHLGQAGDMSPTRASHNRRMHDLWDRAVGQDPATAAATALAIGVIGVLGISGASACWVVLIGVVAVLLVALRLQD